MKQHLVVLACATALASACTENNTDFEDRLEEAAEQSATAAGNAEAALGLSEAQLLEADLVGPGQIELGDVKAVARGPDGQVDRLVIEIEDSDPDRFVYVPISGLTPVAMGDDTNLSTTMTREQLAALPDLDKKSLEQTVGSRVAAAAPARTAATKAAAAATALGLSEAQLRDAELFGPGNIELGDVEGVAHGPDGQVDRLLIEIEDSDPDRFVYVPVSGLTPVVMGGDTNLSTTMTREELAALPDADRSSR